MKWLAIVLIAFVLTGRSPAAQLYTETFASGANGWTGRVAGAGSWVLTGGGASLSFPTDNNPIVAPVVATLSNTPSASWGSFTGNYVAAGIRQIGFSILSSNILPSSLVLAWGDETNTFKHRVSMTGTGLWQHVVLDIHTNSSSVWEAESGSPSNFATTLANVKFVAIRLTRQGQPASTHLIDNIFVDRYPAATAVDRQTGATWSYLIPNASYRLESASSLDDSGPAWSMVTTFTATNSSILLDLPAGTNEDNTFYRLIRE